MIDLFHIPSYKIDTSDFSHLLHDSIVQEFEQNFAAYVGAKYACSGNSASSLLFLSLLGRDTTVKIPSVIPPVVPNLIINSGNKLEFYDDIEWVGSSYHLYDNIIDSAQEVTRNQYKDNDNPNAKMIFSFYPTKPVGSCDGGMVVSDDKDAIGYYRTMTMNGMNFSGDSWEREQELVGYKMHATSIQAYIANENLKRLDEKNAALDIVSNIYNEELGYNNTSRHLYRIRVNNNRKFIEEMKNNGVVCGIHHKDCHRVKCFLYKGTPLPNSEQESSRTVSIPFHEKLTHKEISYVTKKVKAYAKT